METNFQFFLVVECRSIFVPYFKFMLDGIVSHLTSAGGASVSTTRKKKKAKIQETDDTLPPKRWHLRALVLSSLNNCFLHDTGSLKFLDANNFQVTYLLTFYVFLDQTSISWIFRLIQNCILLHRCY